MLGFSSAEVFHVIRGRCIPSRCELDFSGLSRIHRHCCPCLVEVLENLLEDQRSRVRGRGTVASCTVAEIVDVVVRPLGGCTGAAFVVCSGTNNRTGAQWLRDPGQSAGLNPQVSLQDSRCGNPTQRRTRKREKRGLSLLRCLAPALPPKVRFLWGFSFPGTEGATW